MGSGRHILLTKKTFIRMQEIFFDALDETLLDGDTSRLDRVLQRFPSHSSSLVNLSLKRKIGTQFAYWSPIHYVILQGTSDHRSQIVKYLLDHEADPNKVIRGLSPLDLAVQKNNDDVIRVLCQSTEIDFSISKLEFFGDKIDFIRNILGENVSVNFSQKIFVKCLNIMFDSSMKGLCYGFYREAREYCMRREINEFNEHIYAIYKLMFDVLLETQTELNLKSIFTELSNPSVKAKISEKLSKKIKEHDEQKDFKIYPFLKSIFDLQKVNLSEAEDDSYRGVIATGAYIGLESLCTFYSLLRDKIIKIHHEKHFHDPIIFYLPTYKHSTSVGYDPENDCFFMMDANHFPIHVYDPTSEIDLLNLARMTMVSTSFTTSESTIFGTVISSSTRDAENANQLAKNIKDDEEWQKLHKVTREKAQLHLEQRKEVGYKKPFLGPFAPQKKGEYKNASLKQTARVIGDLEVYQAAGRYRSNWNKFKRMMEGAVFTSSYGSVALTIGAGLLLLLLLKGLTVAGIFTFGAVPLAVAALLVGFAGFLIMKKIREARKEREVKKLGDIYKHKNPSKKIQSDKKLTKEVVIVIPIKKEASHTGFFSFSCRARKPLPSRPLLAPSITYNKTRIS